MLDASAGLRLAFRFSRYSAIEEGLDMGFLNIFDFLSSFRTEKPNSKGLGAAGLGFSPCANLLLGPRTCNATDWRTLLSESTLFAAFSAAIRESCILKLLWTLPERSSCITLL